MRCLATCLVGVLLAACGSTAGSAGGASVPPAESELPAVGLVDVEVEPLQVKRDSVALAFDAEAAAGLVSEVPDEIDFATHALVCVYLGPRQTTGWDLDLITATLTDGVLTIRGRETVPRTEEEAVVTYPADCALLTRAGLPPGPLEVRADDTVTGEFIAGTTVEVP